MSTGAARERTDPHNLVALLYPSKKLRGKLAPNLPRKRAWSGVIKQPPVRGGPSELSQTPGEDSGDDPSRSETP